MLFFIYTISFLPLAPSPSVLASLNHLIHNQKPNFQFKQYFCNNLYGQLGSEAATGKVLIRILETRSSLL